MSPKSIAPSDIRLAETPNRRMPMKPTSIESGITAAVMSAARTFAIKYDHRIDADQELLATGAANVAAGFSGGLGVGGSLSKTASAVRAGSTSQVTGVVASGLVLVVLVLFTITALDGPLRWRLLLALAVVGVVITWFVGRKVSTNGARLTMHWQHFQADGGIRATLDEDGNEATLRVRSGIHRAKCVVRRDGVVRDPATWQAVATALSIDPANAAVAQRLHALAAASSG